MDPSVVSVTDPTSVCDNLVTETTGGNDRGDTVELCMCRQRLPSIEVHASWVHCSYRPGGAPTKRNIAAVMVCERRMRAGSTFS